LCLSFAETAVMTAHTPRQPVRRSSPAIADRAGVHRILDACWIAHVGFSVRAQPFVIPMLYARDGDSLLLHGNLGGRLLCMPGREIRACVSVALVDGLVLARAHLQHTMNYRSVVAFGTATVIEDPVAKVAAIACLVDTLVPGRACEARAADPRELAGTTLLQFQIEDASAKVRHGPPVDAAGDLELPVWAGEVALRPGFEDVRPSPDLASDLPLPHSLRRLLASGSTQFA
jgi:nitroimidazol reductase NimA-like FMN-containing flavoprotein (pyridoxamine 5'-phosphate oxidase superfamily)